MDMSAISNASVRANAIGCGIAYVDATNYNIDTFGLIEHPPCVAISNEGSTDLIVGMVMASGKDHWNIGVHTIAAGTEKPVQCVNEFKLSDASATVTSGKISFSGTSGNYYIVLIEHSNAYGATNTLTLSGSHQFVNYNMHARESAITVRNTGYDAFVVNAASTATIDITYGAGFVTAPTAKAYLITDWALREANVIF